ncbi:hypothetical protein D3C72_410620 [compost metagenome]
MTIRSQRYIIDPPSACPPHLVGPHGKPGSTVPLDIDNVARCGWGEILQTAPASTSLFGFLEDLLAPGPSLTWQAQGPGRGTEMRRAFSGLFGRFFARAYLQEHHGFVWFTAIDGNDFHLSPRWRVRRKPGASTEMPDWICAKPGGLAIAEAKGSHQKSNATRSGVPGPIKTAAGQISGVWVERSTPGRPGTPPVWTPQSVKGWAVMSRWGLTSPMRAPFLYALDPETEGEPLSTDDTTSLVQAVARMHLGQTAEGLGLFPQGTSDKITFAGRQRVRVGGDPTGRIFLGGVITPFGILNLDLTQARELASRLPDPRMVQFVGLEESLYFALLQSGRIDPLEAQRIGERTMLGPDGLVVGAISDMIDDKDFSG